MASLVYTVGDRTYRRTTRQGRRPQGFRRWTGRLTAESLDALEAEAKRLHPFYSVNQMVRDAVDEYVRTKLIKQ